MKVVLFVYMDRKPALIISDRDSNIVTQEVLNTLHGTAFGGKVHSTGFVIQSILKRIISSLNQQSHFRRKYQKRTVET